jgi:hypothetical protein
MKCKNDPSLRLRFWVFLMLFLSAYSPLMFIFIVKDVDLNQHFLLRSPIFSGALLFIAVVSTVITLFTARNVSAGLPVIVTKVSNRSGDMFGYTIPYMLSFIRVDFSEWQIIVSLAVFFAVLFIVAYRTQTVFINPILAIAGYLLIDCTFKRDSKEYQAMVVTRTPIDVGDKLRLERLSHYLYINARPTTDEYEGQS